MNPQLVAFTATFFASIARLASLFLYLLRIFGLKTEMNSMAKMNDPYWISIVGPRCILPAIHKNVTITPIAALRKYKRCTWRKHHRTYSNVGIEKVLTFLGLFTEISCSFTNFFLVLTIEIRAKNPMAELGYLSSNYFSITCIIFRFFYIVSIKLLLTDTNQLHADGRQREPSAKTFIPNFGGITYLEAELNAVLCLDTIAKKWKHNF